MSVFTSNSIYTKFEYIKTISPTGFQVFCIITHVSKIMYIFMFARQIVNLYITDTVMKICINDCTGNKENETAYKKCTKYQQTHTYIHSCHTCYQRKIIWRIQDHFALIVHVILGNMLFQTLPYYVRDTNMWLWWWMQSYWKGYVYLQHVFTRDGCCPDSMIRAYRYTPIHVHGFVLGAVGTTLDMICAKHVPSKTLYWFVMFLFEFVIAVYMQEKRINYQSECDTIATYSQSNATNYNNLQMHMWSHLLSPIWILWKVSQMIVVGFVHISRRRVNAQTPLDTFVDTYNYLTRFSGDWFVCFMRRILLWKEYRTYRSFVTKGKTAPYVRAQVMSMFTVVSAIRNNLKDYSKQLIVLKGITSTPIIGSWMRMTLSPAMKNVSTILKKAGPIKKLNKIIDQILSDLQELLIHNIESMGENDNVVTLYGDTVTPITNDYFADSGSDNIMNVCEMRPAVKLKNIEQRSMPQHINKIPASQNTVVFRNSQNEYISQEILSELNNAIHTSM